MDMYRNRSAEDYEIETLSKENAQLHEKIRKLQEELDYYKRRVSMYEELKQETQEDLRQKIREELKQEILEELDGLYGMKSSDLFSIINMVSNM